MIPGCSSSPKAPTLASLVHPSRHQATALSQNTEERFRRTCSNGLTWPLIHFFKQAQEQRYQDYEIAYFQLEMRVKADVSGKKKRNWGGPALPIRSKTRLFKGRISASAPISTLSAEEDCKFSKHGWQKTPQSKGPLLHSYPAAPEESPGSSAPLPCYSWLPRVSGSTAGIRATWVCYARDMLLTAALKSQRHCYYVIGTIKQGSFSVI